MNLPTTIIVTEKDEVSPETLQLFASVMDPRRTATKMFDTNDNHPLSNGAHDDEDDSKMVFTLETKAGVLRFKLNSCGGQIIEHLDRQTCAFCGEATCYHGCDESVAEFVEKDSIDQSES